ncbi:hypothetical protein [Conexivisphaera calida]|uniref:Uncharacterized protein n=1 Tax=Conexivisphaera calida TaxID=1874277 RepID=A0A4P2VE45_9ARCH|nr:hypothetical protein [Conexivisphaera calida]BBE42112.1 167aa long hypothetical protein [Conexivisphaera calida]
MHKIYIIAEDTYGCDFLLRVVDRMRKERVLREELVISRCRHLSVLRNRKVGRVAKAALLDEEDDKVLIVVDADGRRREDVEKDVMPFVSDGVRSGGVDERKVKDVMDRVKLVIFSQEAEEWVVASMGRGFTDGKPSEFLRRTEARGYEKSDLPRYAESLDLWALRKKVPSFSDFIGALDDPRGECACSQDPSSPPQIYGAMWFDAPKRRRPHDPLTLP